MISNFIKPNIKNEALSLKDVFGTDFGISTDGRISVTKDNSLKNSDIVYSCVNYISSTICKMPITLYKDTQEGKTKVNNELSYLLKTRPNQYTSSVDFIQTMVVNMLINGNSFAKIVTNRGAIKELIILEPSVTRLEKASNKWVVVTTIDNKQETLNYNSVIHIKDLCNDGIKGISRLDSLKAKLDNKANSDKMLSDYMCEGGGVKGVLTVPLEDEDSKQNIKDSFNRILRSKKDGVAVLNEEFKYTNIDTMSMADI
ncbi:MAG: phage portal protein, partial [Clostridia bacterium]